jgi:hypothetical protein
MKFIQISQQAVYKAVIREYGQKFYDWTRDLFEIISGFSVPKNLYTYITIVIILLNRIYTHNIQ